MHSNVVTQRTANDIPAVDTTIESLPSLPHHPGHAPVLEACNVSYHVDGAALVSNVSLVLRPGEVFALVGPNGAGKTTLLNILAGDIVPTQGTVLLGGTPLKHMSNLAQARQRAVLRQRVNLAFPFTSLEVVLMGRHPHIGQPNTNIDDITTAQQSLACVEAHNLESRTFLSLSGGEQGRVSLARALAQTTPILLLDEPTAALDLRYQHMTLQLARDIALAGGSVLAILHDLNLAAIYADQVGMLSAGNMVAVGRPWDVFDAPLLREMYRVPMMVQPHPTLGVPLVLTLPLMD
ncbi:MAG: hypothetical protein GFH27_549279n404 [Chloroflexi bacterium AL-W]|nr:hypothetical protein [Chloroflexi bacterium AL-N1]NOK65370.1 hypothetical protein [Chloroflexi bacterium AL-N10]NOK72364.1 hypothetical protein [Chloroflexi bacterium AL-N5]NOK79549.1 hypothetical protein [Chloroflexi bacterium AL-W]NOK87465.1 hypothetical protein [Chloroflexi bacterium AL-N15]